MADRDREELLRLAARCESAAGPSDALDFDIATAIPSLRGKGLSPTSSLDAALTLVPEGMRWSLDSEPSASVYFATNPPTCADCLKAATPALALCAAALRARAAQAD